LPISTITPDRDPCQRTADYRSPRGPQTARSRSPHSAAAPSAEGYRAAGATRSSPGSPPPPPPVTTSAPWRRCWPGVNVDSEEILMIQIFEQIPTGPGRIVIVKRPDGQTGASR